MTESSLEGQPAGFVSRLLGFLLDSVILSTIGIVSGWATVLLFGRLGIDVTDCSPLANRRVFAHALCEASVFLASFAGTAFVVVYYLFFWTTTGQTPGKAVMGVRIQRADGLPMTAFTSGRRLLGYVLSLWSLGLGFLVILVDSRRRGWHDRLAGTCVVYSWKARRTALWGRGPGR